MEWEGEEVRRFRCPVAQPEEEEEGVHEQPLQHVDTAPLRLQPPRLMAPTASRVWTTRSDIDDCAWPPRRRRKKPPCTSTRATASQLAEVGYHPAPETNVKQIGKRIEVHACSFLRSRKKKAMSGKWCGCESVHLSLLSLASSCVGRDGVRVLKAGIFVQNHGYDTSSSYFGRHCCASFQRDTDHAECEAISLSFGLSTRPTPRLSHNLLLPSQYLVLLFHAGASDVKPFQMPSAPTFARSSAP